VDVAASTIGDFGSSDFSIEFTFSGNGVDDITPDGTSGALFIRSSDTGPTGGPLYTGPTAFIWDNGDIKFRMRGDDAMICTGALPDPTSPLPRVLKFTVIQSTLSLFVDGIQSCSMAMTKTPDASKFVSAPLRLGGNHGGSDYQNLHVQLSNIKLADGPPQGMQMQTPISTTIRPVHPSVHPSVRSLPPWDFYSARFSLLCS
jgi:hypothetical protein